MIIILASALPAGIRKIDFDLYMKGKPEYPKPINRSRKSSVFFTSILSIKHRENPQVNFINQELVYDTYS